MKEIVGDLWDYKNKGYIVITTNGALNKLGECVMGRGTALQAKFRFNGLAKQLGTLIKVYGNHVHLLHTLSGVRIISFPVKHHWVQQARIPLIKRSAQELMDMATNFDDECESDLPVYMPRVGCGNGGLEWEKVKVVLAKYLDDRFIIVERR